MNPLFRRVLNVGLSANSRLASAADNAFDWLFLRETLVQSGLTSHEVILEADPMSLRYYPPPAEQFIELADNERVRVEHQRHPVPLVLVPPLGVTTESFDLMPHRSLVRYMAARGFHVYLIDWGKPQRRHAQLGMQDYAQHLMSDALAEVRRHSGSEDITLMGWCMGGLLSLVYMGLTQDKHIRNLITIASPINMRGGGIVAKAATAMNAPAQLVRKFSGWRLHNLNPSRLHSPTCPTPIARRWNAS